MKIISLKIKLVFMFLSVAVFASFGCGDQALFDELATNRVKVIIKGTYESNDPAPWTGTYPKVNYTFQNTIAAEDVDPSLFMLDIAGLKVVDIDNHSQYFANFRKTFSAALDNAAPLFNGEGVLYKNDDVRPNFTWSYVQVYIRKMLFDSAKQYIPIKYLLHGAPIVQ